MNYKQSDRSMISADIGGSHITGAIIDVNTRSVLKDTLLRQHVDCHGSAHEILSGWGHTLNTVIERSGYEIDRLSVAMPGPFDYISGLSYITGLYKYESLYRVNIKEELSKYLGFVHHNIVFRNDAEAFLHGEVVSGAGVGFDHVVGFTLGTGMGSAKSIGGLTLDANWGSIPYGESIADDHFSTRWFLNTYYQYSGRRCRDVKELSALVPHDQHAIAVFDTFAENFSLFILERIRKGKPQCIILGGNISRSYELFKDRLHEHLSPYLPPSVIRTAQLGEDAALIGAAFTFNNEDLSLKKM